MLPGNSWFIRRSPDIPLPFILAGVIASGLYAMTEAFNHSVPPGRAATTCHWGFGESRLSIARVSIATATVDDASLLPAKRLRMATDAGWRSVEEIAWLNGTQPVLKGNM
ncbi:hypothetical protein P167DRAFT_574889 [Morchella conica CCBAS932]|uniref:Uncharacterized protein n=1 Tax=Morchella conica CCBAS932 TaxID=1392247 RepID=A0A3N4KR41_9PEZI|nr:hypothetical protein P167DRAFT_574889 [Morchella conica CCBAS932]